MEAKDTVMNYGTLRNNCIKAGLEPDEVNLRIVQAEISFRAGIREVVEWIPMLIEAIKKEMWADGWGIEHSVIYPDMLDKLVRRKTKAKLEEWGVNDE